MASLIINHDAIQGETFLLGQIFIFGGFALQANSLGHLEQIDSYAPGHQVRFGNLKYIADIHKDLINLVSGFILMIMRWMKLEGTTFYILFLLSVI